MHDQVLKAVDIDSIGIRTWNQMGRARSKSARALSACLPLLVFQVIGKYFDPTRNRIATDVLLAGLDICWRRLGNDIATLDRPPDILHLKDGAETTARVKKLNLDRPPSPAVEIHCQDLKRRLMRSHMCPR